MTSQSIGYESLVRDICSEVASMPESCFHMIVGMIACQQKFAQPFIELLFKELTKTKKFPDFSPIVLAAMKIYVCAEKFKREKAINECLPEFALISAVGKHEDLKKAVGFLTSITHRYIETLKDSSNSTSELK